MNAKTNNVSDRPFFRAARELSSSRIAALVLIPLGAWVALEPFLFGGWSWDWHAGRYMLAVVPGVTALLGGLIMLSARPRAVTVGGSLALGAGIWFLVGPVLYAMFATTELGTLSGGESIRLLQWMPFFFGAGALVSLLGAYSLGLITPMQFADEAWSEPAKSPTARQRVPVPPERTRRQRGAKERGPRAPSTARRKT